LVVAQVEFTYNNLVNRSTGKIPFHIMCGMYPMVFLDLFKLLEFEYKRSHNVDNFVEKMHDVHEQVRERLE